jgi:hypothetical protein
MPIPTFHITISGSVVAAYAAVVSTLTGVVQVFNFYRDRANIKVSVRRDMRIIGDHRYGDLPLTIVRVVNHGRRPVTIMGVGAHRKFPYDNFVLPDCQPQLPHELTEGKSLIAIMRPNDIEFSTIEFWDAWDAVGKSHRLYVAPWHARALSTLRRRRKWRQDAKARRLEGND